MAHSVRQGKNDFGKTVKFYFNYSAEGRNVTYRFSDSTELLSGAEIKSREEFEIPAWGVKIMEEK